MVYVVQYVVVASVQGRRSREVQDGEFDVIGQGKLFVQTATGKKVVLCKVGYYYGGFELLLDTVAGADGRSRVNRQAWRSWHRRR